MKTIQPTAMTKAGEFCWTLGLFKEFNLMMTQLFGSEVIATWRPGTMRCGAPSF